jgi:hypothetical protein
MGYNFYIQTVTVYHKFLAVLDIFYEKILYGLPAYWIIHRNRKKVCGLISKKSSAMAVKVRRINGIIYNPKD